MLTVIHTHRMPALLVTGMLLAGMLAGCFRQADPNVQPTNSGATLPPVPLEAGTPSFVTPFAPGEGPDINTMPTLSDPTSTLALVEPGVTNAAPGAVDNPPAGSTATIPFAAGPTYTPRPGAPPVNLNPNLPGQVASPTRSVAISRDCIYVVEVGDTAFYIAQQLDVSLNDLVQTNRLENPNQLYEGQELQIPNCGPNALPTQPAGPTPIIQPPPATPTSMLPPPVDAEGNAIHVVQPGENLYRIALRYGVSMDVIVAANNLGSQNAILVVGQQLVIPQQP